MKILKFSLPFPVGVPKNGMAYQVAGQRLNIIVVLALLFIFAVLFPAKASLPSGWSDTDIGTPADAGSASDTNGAWSVSGGGADIQGTADQFNFASTNFTGDGTMIVQVTSLQNSDPGSGWAKAGLMFRNDSTAGSVNVSIVGGTHDETEARNVGNSKAQQITEL
jgi:hypothetical protein